MKQTNATFLKIVETFNDGEFHDGTSIGEKLKISRTAVWKALKKLEEYGIPVESIKGKGYALTEPLILLDKKKIMGLITHKNIELELFESIPSTSDFLLNTPHSKKIKICVAEHQTQGRGRFGRAFHAPFAKNIYLSLKYPFEKDVSQLAGLSLVICLAILKTLHTLGLSKDIQIKWPNDIIYQGKKLGGSLIDVRAEANGFCHATIGLFINVNMTDDEGAIAQPWVSLKKIHKESIDRNIIIPTLINNIITYIEKFEKQGFSDFTSEWKTHDSLFNKTITLSCGNQKSTGIAKGISAQGHLRLQITPDKISEFSSGDTTIVKNTA